MRYIREKVKRSTKVKRKKGLHMTMLSKPNRNTIMINQSNTKLFIQDTNKCVEENKKFLSSCKETSKLFKRKF